ncbi:MAG: cytochrome c oxidase assembly protein [Methylococcaceae bacterium]|nr:cytochrome c oxidase assembly protein [Methylococcaceae bacterium]
MKISRLACLLSGLLLAPAITEAHVPIDPNQSIWLNWVYTPEIALPLLFTVVIYFRGHAKRRDHNRPVPALQIGLFLAGILSFIIALQSPLEPLSDHFLFMHQIEHMLIRSIAPLFIILSMPLAPLIQGLPSLIRHGILAPLMRNRILKGLYLFLGQPAIASLIFIGTLLIWQIPNLHDQAVFDRPLHDSMHATMIISGFFFWWLICDPRQQSARLSYGIRLIILWAVTIPNTIIGAIITLSHQQIYKAYDVLHGDWGIQLMLDQQLGGIIIWGPDGMMAFLGTAIVFVLWWRQEKNNDRRLAIVSKRDVKNPVI